MSESTSEVDWTVNGQAEGRVPSDRSLLRRYRDGEEDAATQLYMRYADRLRALAASQCSTELAQRVDPDDVVQSVFRTFFRRIASSGYDVPAGSELWKLFLVIALNKIRSLATFHRAAKRDMRLTGDRNVFENALETLAQPSQSAMDVLRLVINDILNSLPAVQRQIIELRIEEHEIAEIARNTGRSKRTVERVLQRFRKRLQKELDLEGG